MKDIFHVPKNMLICDNCRKKFKQTIRDQISICPKCSKKYPKPKVSIDTSTRFICIDKGIERRRN